MGKSEAQIQMEVRMARYNEGHARGVGDGWAIACAICSVSARRELHGLAKHRGGETLDAFERGCKARGIGL